MTARGALTVEASEPSTGHKPPGCPLLTRLAQGPTAVRLHGQASCDSCVHEQTRPAHGCDAGIVLADGKHDQLPPPFRNVKRQMYPRPHTLRRCSHVAQRCSLFIWPHRDIDEPAHIQAAPALAVSLLLASSRGGRFPATARAAPHVAERRGAPRPAWWWHRCCRLRSGTAAVCHSCRCPSCRQWPVCSVELRSLPSAG